MSGWRDAWLAVLSGAAPDAAAAGDVRRRRAQGRAYARAGRVVDVRWSAGRLSGRVQGSRVTPYGVEVGVTALDDRAWSDVAEALAAQARHSAQLLAGHVPDRLDRELAAIGVDLLPRVEDLDGSCPCGDRRWRCAHVWALWEAASDQLQEDPFLLLRLRGRGRARLLAELSNARRRRGVGDRREGLPVAQLEVRGWTTARTPLDGLGMPAAQPPGTPAGVLRLLGDPPGWRGGVDMWSLLAPLLAEASAWAQELDAD